MVNVLIWQYHNSYCKHSLSIVNALVVQLQGRMIFIINDSKKETGEMS